MPQACVVPAVAGAADLAWRSPTRGSLHSPCESFGWSSTSLVTVDGSLAPGANCRQLQPWSYCYSRKYPIICRFRKKPKSGKPDSQSTASSPSSSSPQSVSPSFPLANPAAAVSSELSSSLGSSESGQESTARGVAASSASSPLTSPISEQVHSEYDEYEEDNGGEDELDVYRGLILDLAYRPVNVVCWKRALCLDILEKADVLQYYDQVVKSASHSFPIPAVLRVSTFAHAPKERKRRLSLSRNNIFLRDQFRCQYCGSKRELTIDHVIAISRGGGSSWENLVTACLPCNLKKGDKTLAEAGMKLLKLPKEPMELDSDALPPNYKTFRSLRHHRGTPAEWLDWLPLKQPSMF